MSPLSKAMSPSEDLDSPVQEFYRDATILITGGTGFLGKVLIEKLLRSCPDIRQILLLIRDKKEANCQERLDIMMEDTILKGVAPKNWLKVTAVPGDCTMPGLGLSEADRQNLLNTVTVVFHVAATVRFDEDLATAVSINITGTKTILELARDMTKLKAFVHVSTAYSQSYLQHVEERFYPSKYNPEKLIRLTEVVEKPYLDQLTPLLLQDCPNTYIYTKGVAEELVRTHSKGLPVGVFRPSIVVATHNEPFPGWIDNLYGPTGVVVATSTGIMRTLHCDPDMVADIVPADMVVNALIASAFQIHLLNHKIETMDDEPPVFNFVSSPEKPIHWSEFFQLGMKYQVPTIHAVWHPSLSLNRSRRMHNLQHFFCHLVPAYIVDKIAAAVGKRTNLLKITKKVDRFGQLISPFSTREWTFDNDNVKNMWEMLAPRDKTLFPFTFKELEWESYFKTYIKGTRLYLLKDDMSTVARAKVRGSRIYYLHQALKFSLLYLLAKLVWRVGSPHFFRFIYLIISRSPALR